MSFIKDSLNLRGRKALVTGSSGQLGKVFVEYLGELGCDLILVDLDSEVMKEESERIRETYGVVVNFHEIDLESKAQRASLIDRVKYHHSNLNILVNNAAFVGTSQLSGWAGDFESQSVETFKRALEVNLTANFELIQGLTPMLKASVGASIVNVSSIYGLSGPVWELYAGTDMGNPAAYAASKGGLIQLTRWLARTLAPNIRVNSIAPGGLYAGQDEKFVKRYTSRVPLNRMANKDDIAGALIFLASDLGRYVTGQVLIVDGGWTV